MDDVLQVLSDYVCNTKIQSEEAYHTARLTLMDSMGCAFLALNFPECTKLLGPVMPGTKVPMGSRVPGTEFVLDPIRGAFNFGTMIRWLDYNDTWLAKEWGHPSDNIGGLLALSDMLSQRALHDRRTSLNIQDLLSAIIKAYEIQGILALSNSFNQIGFDHVILVKIATAALAAFLLGESKEQVANTLSQAFIDTGPLRTYRHAPNTGSRKSWAAGDATARGVALALLSVKGEMGYPQALSAPKWGFNDALLPITIEQKLGSYVMENILFKVKFPAEFHAQTAVECAIKLHPEVSHRLHKIARIEVDTHESAMRIINKKGPLKNPADRDHCLQYMVAVALLKGHLTADDYEFETAADPQIDLLREKMVLTENKSYSVDYLNPMKRSIANAITIHFQDGSKTERIEVEYPIGHKRRREEAHTLLFQKCQKNLETRISREQSDKILTLFKSPEQLDRMAVKDFVDLYLV